jgi:pyruvate-formate lyase-activating enzyme
MQVMKKRGKFVSLNYFIFPGFTDDSDEFQAFCTLIGDYKPDFIQLRNMNMDPDWYIEAIELTTGRKSMGIQTWLSKIKKNFPNLQFGYFNPALF